MKRSIAEFAGAWSDMSEIDVDGLKENIRKIKKTMRHRGLKAAV